MLEYPVIRDQAQLYKLGQDSFRDLDWQMTPAEEPIRERMVHESKVFLQAVVHELETGIKP